MTQLATAATGNRAAPAAGEISLVLRRTSKAPPEGVFRAWTEPAQLARWFGPAGFRCTAQTVDARPGGSYRITMVSPEGEATTVGGEFLAIEPPRRIAFSWSGCGGGAGTMVEVAIAPHPAGSELTLTHRHFVSEADRDAHENGWTLILDQLAARLAAV